MSRMLSPACHDQVPFSSHQRCHPHDMRPRTLPFSHHRELMYDKTPIHQVVVELDWNFSNSLANYREHNRALASALSLRVVRLLAKLGTPKYSLWPSIRTFFQSEVNASDDCFSCGLRVRRPRGIGLSRSDRFGACLAERNAGC